MAACFAHVTCHACLEDPNCAYFINTVKGKSICAPETTDNPEWDEKITAGSGIMCPIDPTINGNGTLIWWIMLTILVSAAVLIGIFYRAKVLQWLRNFRQARINESFSMPTFTFLTGGGEGYEEIRM